MAGKHTGAGDESTLGANYIAGGRIDKAYAEGRQAGIVAEQTGADDTSVAQATMTQSDAGLTIDAEIGKLITNVTNSTATVNQNATITDNTATVVTGVLSGSGNWDSTDVWHITGALVSANPHVAGTDESIAWLAGFDGGYAANKQFETDRA